MKINVDFDVHAVTLDEAIVEARAKLAQFAPTFGDDDWDIVMNCSPALSSINGGALRWHVQVEATG